VPEQEGGRQHSGAEIRLSERFISFGFCASVWLPRLFLFFLLFVGQLFTSRFLPFLSRFSLRVLMSMEARVAGSVFGTLRCMELFMLINVRSREIQNRNL
jgi:hypothetical protein